MTSHNITVILHYFTSYSYFALDDLHLWLTLTKLKFTVKVNQQLQLKLYNSWLEWNYINCICIIIVQQFVFCNWCEQCASNKLAK